MSRTTPTSDPQQPSLLDLDAAGDAPVPFLLTARARRVIDPESLPSLEVVAPTIPSRADPEDDEVLVDPRRSRARALRRAGMLPEVIAADLDADLELVLRWTQDVEPAKRTAPHPAARRRRTAEPALPAAFVTARAAARAAWKRGPEIGAAMVAGMAEVTPFAVRLRGELPTIVGALQWLRDSQAVPDARMRVQVEAAANRSADVVAHEVASRLQLPADVVQVRAVSRIDEDDLDVSVRIGDPRLAGTITGWRDSLLAELAEARAVDPETVAG